MGACRSLRHLVLDNNPIRKPGVRFLMSKQQKAIIKDGGEETLEEKAGTTDLRSRAQVRELFDKFDEDGSNHMDESELLRFVRIIGLEWEPDRVRETFAKMDKDGSGSVDFTEFYTWLIKNLDAEVAEEVSRA